MTKTKESHMPNTRDRSVATVMPIFGAPGGTEPPGGGSARAPPRDVARESL